MCAELYFCMATEHLQLKAEYKVVQILNRLSGFGWEEGEQMVTAPLQVWETVRS